MSTSYEQKNCKDGASNITGSNTSRIDAVSDILGRLDISNNDDDDKLFADPPPKEDCPICMQPMPYSNGLCGVATAYMPCCGKILCEGCVIAAEKEMKKGNMKRLCPFCRIPISPTNQEDWKRTKKRIKLNDPEAFRILGSGYRSGRNRLPKDKRKSVELFSQAAELGSIRAHDELASAYFLGEGVNKDMNKAMHHWKLAAMGGHETARHCLGMKEVNNGNIDKGMKHFIIAAKSGLDDALKQVGKGYKDGLVTKDDYASTLRAHKDSQDEMKSVERSVAVSMRG